MQSEQSADAPPHMFLSSLKQWQTQRRTGNAKKAGLSVCLPVCTWRAKMVLGTGMHPGELKDMVCSPAGTTIEGVRTLEKNGFRSAVFEALQAASDKGKQM